MLKFEELSFLGYLISPEKKVSERRRERKERKEGWKDQKKEREEREKKKGEVPPQKQSKTFHPSGE